MRRVFTLSSSFRTIGASLLLLGVAIGIGAAAQGSSLGFGDWVVASVLVAAFAGGGVVAILASVRSRVEVLGDRILIRDWLGRERCIMNDEISSLRPGTGSTITRYVLETRTGGRYGITLNFVNAGELLTILEQRASSPLPPKH